MFSVNGDDILFNGVLVGYLVDTQPIGVRIDAEHMLVDGLADENRQEAYDEGHGDGYTDCEKEWIARPGYEEGKEDGHTRGYCEGYDAAMAEVDARDVKA